MIIIEIFFIYVVNEEYLGECFEDWIGNVNVLVVFVKFGKKVDEIDVFIKVRNVDFLFKYCNGFVVVLYEFL